jgi:hypothetical protein
MGKNGKNCESRFNTLSYPKTGGKISRKGSMSQNKSLPKNGEAISKNSKSIRIPKLFCHLGTDNVQRAAGLKPFYLLCIIGMVNREAFGSTIGVVQYNGKLLIRRKGC